MYNSNTKESVLKQNDCRYGNYIIYGGSITQLNEKEMCHFFRFPGTYKPIHLTEEWLIKFGFEKIIDNEFTLRYELKKDPRFDYFFPKHNLKTFGLRFQGSTFFDDVKYVHQLQNLYFALTDRELTVA